VERDVGIFERPTGLPGEKRTTAVFAMEWESAVTNRSIEGHNDSRLQLR
jgi:hypothetical protein